MVDTRGAGPVNLTYLIPPRGNRRSWVFRMKTPAILIGQPVPDKRGEAFGAEIRRGLGRCSAAEAGRKRDVLAGQIRQWADAANGILAPGIPAEDGKAMAEALAWARKTHGEDSEEANFVRGVAYDQYETIRDHASKRTTPEQQEARASRYAAQVHDRKSVKDAHAEYAALRKAVKGRWGLAKNSLIELRKTADRFTDHMGDDVPLSSVTREDVNRFAVGYMAKLEGPKGPLTRPTIINALSYLNGLWRWAEAEGFLDGATNPWDGYRLPLHVGRDTSDEPERDPFTREEWKALAEATPPEKPLGDGMRVALLTGARRGEIASLRPCDITRAPDGFHVRKGKTANAVRWVPLVGMARKVILRRFQAALKAGDDTLFADVKAINKGDALGKRFTTKRRKVLGKDTDDRLAFHSFRHTFQTAARRAGIAKEDSGDVCGWTEGKNKGGSGERYDHGHDPARYIEIVEAVAAEYHRAGYLTAEEAGIEAAPE